MALNAKLKIKATGSDAQALVDQHSMDAKPVVEMQAAPPAKKKAPIRSTGGIKGKAKQ